MKEQVFWLIAIIGVKKKLLGALLFLGGVILPVVVCTPQV
jgi:hypothetical protein